MNMTVLKYAAFNIMLAGTITLATVYKIDLILAVSNWWFGIEAALYLIAVFLSGTPKFFEDVLNKPGNLVAWKAILEPGWVVYMFSLGHAFNGVCMAFTAMAYAYLVIVKHAKNQEATL